MEGTPLHDKNIPTYNNLKEHDKSSDIKQQPNWTLKTFLSQKAQYKESKKRVYNITYLKQN